MKKHMKTELSKIIEPNGQAKKYIDYFGINEDNVSEISEYAYGCFLLKRFDEVEAEIKAKKE